MTSPENILESCHENAITHLSNPTITDAETMRTLKVVCMNIKNRAGVRLLMSCLLAKVHEPSLDVRKPYTKIDDDDCFSGRTYDERYITAFISKYQLPCNPTTAFLTPALRNRDIVLTPDVDLIGRPPIVYECVVSLLAKVHSGEVNAGDLLAETVRQLIIFRDKKKERIESLLSDLETAQDSNQLPVKMILTIIEQHLQCPDSSRLPVLVVAAAYEAAKNNLGEKIVPLEAHTAADSQTGSLGDLEVTLINDDNVITSYEMKTRKITKNTIDRALAKIATSGKRVDNYMFVTTEPVDQQVVEYAESIYEKTAGIEFAILDCIGFVQHFLYLFYRLRTKYLDTYQATLLTESESAVRQELKEAFLALRQAAETANKF